MNGHSHDLQGSTWYLWFILGPLQSHVAFIYLGICLLIVTFPERLS